MKFVRDVVGWASRTLGRNAPAVSAYLRALDQIEDLKAIAATIKSARDEPRTLKELMDRVSGNSEYGYHDHHIAEKGAAYDAGTPGIWLRDAKIKLEFQF